MPEQKWPSCLDSGRPRMGVFECWSELGAGDGHCQLNRYGAYNQIARRWSRLLP